jgi:hypothetical protein
MAVAGLSLAMVQPAAASEVAIGQRAISTVEQSVPTDAQLAGATPLQLLKAVVRCADVGSDQQYCMRIGFMSPSLSPDQLNALLVRAAAGPDTDDGVATLLGAARQVAARPYEQRVTSDRAEISTAVTAVDRPQLMSAAAAPARKVLLMGAPRQITNWYCGPASVAAVAMGHSPATNQGTWAYRLHATQDGGTSVADMPGVLNYYTDRDTYGTYSTVSAGNTSADTYLSYLRTAIYEHNHPAIQQVKLYKAFFPYLRVNHGGHFQPVNGYDTVRRTVIFTEVYNEATYTSGGAASGGPKELPVASVFAASKASYNAMPGVFGRLVI